jgi:glutathione S-transferase
VEKYAKDDSLYPKDILKRTKVNEKLFYIGNYIFPRLFQIFYPGYFGWEIGIPQRKHDEIIKGYNVIETFLTDNVFLAGDTLTLPDLYLWCCMESLGPLIPFDEEKFPNFNRWLKEMRKLPTSDMNQNDGGEHVAFYRQCQETPFVKKS